MLHTRARRTVIAITLALIATIAIAACGSSATTGSKTSSASASPAASTSTGRAKLAACLKQHGVTLPSRPAGGQRPGGTPPGAGAGGATPPGGASGGGGYGGGGYGYGYGYGYGGQGGGGFFGGGGAGGAGGTGATGAQSSKFRAALKACGATFGAGRGRFAHRGAGARPSAAALAKFTACVAQHGYTLPKPNTSGTGPIFPKSIESNKKFEAAAKVCQSDLT